MIFPKNLTDFNSDFKAEEYKKFIRKLVQMQFLHVPQECERCGGTKIHVQNLNSSKNSKVCFRCMNDACKNIISIRQDSFFDRHPKIPLKYLYDIMKCFTLYNFNAEETLKYLYEENKRRFLKETVLTIYSELRQELRKYYYREYLSHPFVEAGNMNFTDFSIIAVDEAVFAIEKVYEDDQSKPENKFIAEDKKDEQKEEAEKADIKRKKKIEENNHEEAVEDAVKQAKDDSVNKREVEALKQINKQLKQKEEPVLDKALKKVLESEKKKQLISEYKEAYEGEDQKEPAMEDYDHRKYQRGADGKLRPNYRLRPYWVLGMINTVTQDFRVMLIPDRSMLTLKAYLTKYIKEYNEIITDGYQAYSFLDADLLALKIDIMVSMLNSRKKEDRPKLSRAEVEEMNQFAANLLNIRNYYCYTGRKYLHRAYNHSKFEFGRGIESSSHIEGLWGNLKTLIKGIYHQIPVANLNLFLKEAEFKFKLRGKTYKEKMQFLAKILNENSLVYKAETADHPMSVKEYDTLREKEEELSKALIKTEQPKPISKRIQRLLEKYRKKKYQLKETKENSFGRVEHRENKDFGKYVVKNKIDPKEKVLNQFPLERKEKIHQEILAERAHKKRAHFEPEDNQPISEKLSRKDVQDQEARVTENRAKPAEITEAKLKKINKTRKAILENTGAGNNFIDDYFPPGEGSVDRPSGFWDEVNRRAEERRRKREENLEKKKGNAIGKKREREQN